jgi:hypothetical protein
MPMIGLVDPSHYERRHHKAGRLPQWMTLDEVRAAASEPNPKWSPWPVEMVEAAIGEHQERGDRLSSSALTAPCPRGEVIKRKMDYIGTLDGMYLPVRGTMVHKMLEHYARPGSMAEYRFYTTVDDIEVSCSPDLLTEEAVYDWKVTDNPPGFGYPYRHHTEQVQFNAFIARHMEHWDPPSSFPGGLLFDPREHPVKHAVVVYLGPKGPKVIETERKQEFITPTGAKREGNRPYVWTDDEVLAEMRPRLHMLHEGLKSFPEWPEPMYTPDGEKYRAEEVWGGEPDWACPGPPLCHLPDCLAKRWPNYLTWENVDEKA